jgi:hypothetical protein
MLPKFLCVCAKCKHRCIDINFRKDRSISSEKWAITNISGNYVKVSMLQAVCLLKIIFSSIIHFPVISEKKYSYQLATLIILPVVTLNLVQKVFAQTTGCAAQGCVQAFGVKGDVNQLLPKWSGMSTSATSPSASITKGWAVGPNGLTTLTKDMKTSSGTFISRKGIPHYIESGPSKDCSRGCSNIYPYTTSADINGCADEQSDTSIKLSPSAYYTYGIRYVGSSRWEAYWCDTACYSFVPVNLKQGNGFSFVASGGESSAIGIPFGNITSTNHKYISAGSSTQLPWCWDFPVLNPLNIKTVVVGSCNSSTTTFTVSYDGALRMNLKQRQANSRKPLSQVYFKRRSLTDASEADVAKAMVNYTRSRFTVLSGVPKAVFVKPVTQESLIELGLDSLSMNFANEAPPLMVVIVETDIDVKSFHRGISAVGSANSEKQLPNRSGISRERKDQSNSVIRARYVGYLVDLIIGLPTRTVTSQNGDAFKSVLNKPIPSERKLRFSGKEAVRVRLPKPEYRGPKKTYGSTSPSI